MIAFEPRNRASFKNILFCAFCIISFIALSSAFFFRWVGRDQSTSATTVPASNPRYHWVDTFGATPQWIDYNEHLPKPFYGPSAPLRNVTIRQTIQTTVGAGLIRFRFSNTFGAVGLPLTKVSIARPRMCCQRNDTFLGTTRIDTTSHLALTFSGSEAITIPAGGLVLSDPVEFATQPGQVIVVDTFLQQGHNTTIGTGHPVSRTATWFASGDLTGTPNIELANPIPRPGSHIVSGVEAWVPARVQACHMIGDSVTEARKSGMNQGRKWPQLLWKRMNARLDAGMRDIAIINSALGGNQILADGKSIGASARLDRDVLSHSGARYVVLLLGINDIGHANDTEAAQDDVLRRLRTHFHQLITRLHTSNIAVFGGTLTPFICPPGVGGNAHANAATREDSRQKLNGWIRTSGTFDAVVDFDEMVRDPYNATVMKPEFDSGDCLHPNDWGNEAIARRFPVELFIEFKDGVNAFQ